MSRKYSIIIPVYNRPDEVEELLQCLVNQTYTNFEVVIIEDGSVIKCDAVVEKFKHTLEINYYFQQNTGQGFARNTGFKYAQGDYFIILDSDVIIPIEYLSLVDKHLTKEWFDAYGGPDGASPEFTHLQKAISYSMTSIFTTGGIRGKKNGIGKFQPRSFNMGISAETFSRTGGFTKKDMGEDIELSLRMEKMNLKVGLIAEAVVFHKRRGNFKDFFKQIYSFGRTRIQLREYDSDNLKLVHTFPMLFTLGCFSIPFLYFIYKPLFYAGIIFLGLYILLNFIDSTLKNKSIKVGILSVIAIFVQLFGYGIGFITEGWKRFFEEKGYKQTGERIDYPS